MSEPSKSTSAAIKRQAGATAVHIHSFAPIANPACEVLILGSMPGKASLRESQYYAHPQNAFWKIVSKLLEFEQDAAYQARLDCLLQNRIALWDVLKTCTRASSLDADIVDSSSAANNFAAFFAEHRKLSTVLFNGAKAESSFRKLVLPTLPPSLRLDLHRLPSTSPANASIPYRRKLEQWGLLLSTRC